MWTMNPNRYSGISERPRGLEESALWAKEPKIESIPMVEIGERRATTSMRAGRGLSCAPSN
jgi:hypothetical protein